MAYSGPDRARRAFRFRFAMAKRHWHLSRLERKNRRGCAILAIILALVMGALAYIGLHGDPISEVDSVIPTGPLR